MASGVALAQRQDANGEAADQQPYPTSIPSAIAKVKAAQPEDVIFIYFAGRGMVARMGFLSVVKISNNQQ